VGIESVEDKNAVALYPNPVSDVLTIQAEGLQKAELMDMSGRRIVTATEPRIDMSRLPSGAYFVRIVTSHNSIVKRVVKK
jgi:hypothetical protein